MSDFVIEMPEETVTPAEMARRYTEVGGWCYDPAKQAYRFSFQQREWHATLDNTYQGDCTTTSEEIAVWNVVLWYTWDGPGTNYVCIEGVRESAGFYLLRNEVCTVNRELVPTRTWTEWLPRRAPLKQRFVYVHADGSDSDASWRDVAE